MKTLVLFIGLVGCMALVLGQAPPPPINLRLGTAPATASPDLIPLQVVAGANNPLGLPMQGYSVWWRPEPNWPSSNFGGMFLTNTWLPEATTNGSDWNLPMCHAAFIGTRVDRNSDNVPPQWNFSEVGSNWTVRIRRLPPQKIQ